jgi:hypothetical protein
MDNFTLTQLKKIIKYFNIKIKVGGKKADLIERIEDHIIFDGYEFHVKGSDDEIIINPDELHVEKNQYVRGAKKPQYTYKKVSNTYKDLPSKKVKIINKENIYEIKPSKKVKIIKRDYIPPLLSSEETTNKGKLSLKEIRNLRKAEREEREKIKAEQLSEEISKYGMPKRDYLYLQRNTPGTKAYTHQQELKKINNETSKKFQKTNSGFFNI